MNTIETTIKERPILFSGAMVRALLEGSKTQTRRVVKGVESNLEFWRIFEREQKQWFAFRSKETSHEVKCPYGQPGERLWVRETWQVTHADFDPKDRNRIRIDGVYPGTGDLFSEWLTEEESDKFHQWKRQGGNQPGIFMFRSLSRILLEIESVRVERLQEISVSDAIAEGVSYKDSNGKIYYPPTDLQAAGHTPYLAYRSLWKSINGAASWDANPWVWVVTFKRIKP